jgi:hypothetical protein
MLHLSSYGIQVLKDKTAVGLFYGTSYYLTRESIPKNLTPFAVLIHRSVRRWRFGGKPWWKNSPLIQAHHPAIGTQSSSPEQQQKRVTQQQISRN